MGKSNSKTKKEKDEKIPDGMLRIYINGTNTKIHCYPYISIGNLASFIREKLEIPSNCHMILIHNHLILQPDTDLYKSLNHYNIKNDSCLFLCVSERQNTPKLSITTLLRKSNQREFRNSCCSMTINDGFIESMTDLDILTYETSSKCLKMKCGHGMTKQTLYEYTLSQLNSGDKIVKCPHIETYNNTKCNDIWYHPLIKNVLMYKNGNDSSSIPLQDILKLDVISAENMIKNECMITHCKKCDICIYRDKFGSFIEEKYEFDPRTFCPICDNVFCWQCHCEWKDLNSNECTKKCTFNFKGEVIDILESCPAKTIGDVDNVPSIRCCPKCLQLITHTEACKHVKCKSCQCYFCFVCMGINDGEWHCGSSGTVCPVAPREIPKIIK